MHDGFCRLFLSSDPDLHYTVSTANSAKTSFRASIVLLFVSTNALARLPGNCLFCWAEIQAPNFLLHPTFFLTTEKNVSNLAQL
jgi:hypothetical protein